MNKTMKVISTLVIALVLVAVLSQTILASSQYTGVIDNLDSKANSSTASVDGITTKAGDILKVIRNVAAILSIFVITILGIKYIMGSVEEKANYKKTFIPVIVGIVVVVAATTIATELFKLGA